MLTKLEQRIADMIGVRNCVLTGHGSTSIFTALQFVKSQNGGGEVLLPSIGCASIAQMVIYAGFTPRFIDMDRETFTIDMNSVRNAVTPESRAIMPVHIFGHACNMTVLMEIARQHRLYVIEDCAQSFGGKWNGRPLGSFGDAAILSFGGSKVVSVGGGGALVTDDSELAGFAREAVARMPVFDSSLAYQLAQLSHRNLYHGVVDLLRTTPEARVSSIFRTGMPYYKHLYFHRFPKGVELALSSALDSLSADLPRRIERAEAYRQRLQSLDMFLTDAGIASGAIWRYSMAINDARLTQPVTRALRRAGFHVSNHYWSLADIFNDDKSLSNTSWFCPRVVNLWVDDQVDDDDIDASCAVIRKALDSPMEVST